MSLSSSPFFSIEAPAVNVRVVTFHRPPVFAEWPGYIKAYMAMYVPSCPQDNQFVLVFDTRGLTTLPGLDMIQAKRELLDQLKPITVRTVAAVVVLLHSPLLATVVTCLIKSGGQTAPFYVEHDFPVAIERVKRSVALVRNVKMKDTTTETSGAGTVASPVSNSVFFSRMAVTFLLCMTHLVRASRMMKVLVESDRYKDQDC